jgi:diamine N-acetyltransferase
MSVTLREITLDNWKAVIALSIPEEQSTFVSSNLYSIAEASFYPEIEMRAIYARDDPVGFVEFSINPDDGCYWIWKLMVDGREQGKGYGRTALTTLLEHFRTEGRSQVVKISWTPDNSVAERFYLSLGFRKTGEISDGEVVGRLDFHEDAVIL